MDEKKRVKELKERIDDKIQELEKDLEEFQTINIPEFEEYKKDFKTKAASEHYFERIVENIISIALLFIRLKRFSIPESEDHAFLILSKNKVINENFAKRLKDAKDMRNRIVHNYISVDDIIVYRAVTEEIIKDAEEFLNSIKKAV